MAHVQHNLSYEKAHQHPKGSTLRTDLYSQSSLRPLDSEKALFHWENSALKAPLQIHPQPYRRKQTHSWIVQQSSNYGHTYNVLVPTCSEDTGSLGQHLSYFLCANEFPVLDSIPRVAVLIATRTV